MSDRPLEQASTGIVERQIDAFNRRSLDDLTACFASSVELTVDGMVAASGRDALRAVYSRQFDDTPVHATVLSRMVQADWVVDREQAVGADGTTMTVLALYRVRDGLIDRVQLVGQQVEA